MKLINQNINALKKSIIYKHKFCLLKKSSLTLALVKLFLKYNLIKKFIIIDCNKLKMIKIEYNYYNNYVLIKKLILFNKKHHCFAKQSIFKNLLFGEFFYVVSTSKGLLINKDCLKNKTGGVILCKIYI